MIFQYVVSQSICLFLSSHLKYVLIKLNFNTKERILQRSKNSSSTQQKESN